MLEKLKGELGLLIEDKKDCSDQQSIRHLTSSLVTFVQYPDPHSGGGVRTGPTVVLWPPMHDMAHVPHPSSHYTHE